MILDLRKLKYNPFRDFKIDPIDEAIIDRLVASIGQDGFWGGVVCRRNKYGEIEIAAGHHRVLAALKCGITEADLFVGDYDDATMIRVYVRENATQRGNDHGTAMAGSVASAVRFLAKMVLTNSTVDDLSTIVERSSKIVETARGNLLEGEGIGETLILRFLVKCPGITTRSVREQVANLKASGDYARIIAEVETEIKREEEEAAAALAQAEAEQRAAEERVARAREDAERKQAEKERKAAEAEAERLAAIQQNLAAASADAEDASTQAAKNVRIFDFAGVSQHLKNALQVDAFREAVTEPNVAAFLPIDKQADLAAELVKLARDTKDAKGKSKQLSADFIRDRIIVTAQHLMGLARAQTEWEIREAEKRDTHLLVKNLQAEFVQHVHGIHSAGTRLAKVLRDNSDTDFNITSEFRKAVSDAQKIINQLNRSFGYGTEKAASESTIVGNRKPQARIALSR